MMRAAAGAILLAAAFPYSAAAAWPERPITLLQGFGVGGNADLTARAVADSLSARLGQTVVVEPRPGAGGRIAAAAIAKAPPDGYTLFMLPGGHASAAAMHEKLPYDPINDFTFIGLVTQLPFVVSTYPDHPVKTLPELIAAAKKAASEPLLYGTSGVGTTMHLSAALLEAKAKIKLKHVPSKGGTAPATMLLGKFIQLSFEPPPVVLPLIKDGKLRAIATTGPERYWALPSVPAVAEAIPGYEVTSYFGLVGPANLPADIVKRLNEATVAMAKEPKLIERFKALGSLPLSGTPEGFKQRVVADIKLWTQLVKEAGIQRIGAAKK
jgi:tripartite-type tricarboxylate transporter receptor subunit TctC